jgi:hypothetical protein
MSTLASEALPPSHHPLENGKLLGCGGFLLSFQVVPMIQDESFIDAHPLTKDFDIRCAKYRGRMTLRLVKRNLNTTIPLAALGNILDCAARLAGNGIFEDCIVSECEISIHTQLTKELIVSTRIVDSDAYVATFQCEIQGLNQRSRALVAEAHGTLVKTRFNQLTVA